MTNTDPDYIDRLEETYRIALLVLELEPCAEHRAMATETYTQIVDVAGEDEANEIHRCTVCAGFFVDTPATLDDGWTPTEYDDRGA